VTNRCSLVGEPVILEGEGQAAEDGGRINKVEPVLLDIE